VDNNEDEMRGSLARYGVPVHLHEGLIYYGVHRVQPGEFLLAVLSNDLRESFARADEESAAGMQAIVTWVYNEIPAAAWGSPGAVRSWLAGRT
jgi:hypothetical protein